jgi:YD repeat-containing protein
MLAETGFCVKEQPALRKFLFIALLLWPALSAFACGASFSNNGNLANDGTRTFGYNTENQLTNVFVPGQWRSDFIYDGLGRRRIVREYSWSGSA